MPYVTISASQSFSSSQKRQLITSASDAVLATIDPDCLPRVRVLLQELSAEQYLCAGEFGQPVVMYWVELLEGRSDDRKRALADALRKAAAAATGIDADIVKVRIVDYTRAAMGLPDA